ncbi:MAG: septal ring lytic transglycosylase RlpA family lipoprotein [Deltaproteobacteria bacterium]|nr:MAG: septal ring lytic transglycosylase RlpA family lipoprotein [Deltaproteobacteria bacterium]
MRKATAAFFKLHITAGVCALFFLISCAAPDNKPPARPRYPKPYKVGKQWYHPKRDAVGFRQRGIASWYGEDFHGHRTASGEIYNMHAMTAAHKTLPLGTYVRVHNLRNGKKVVVRINDRGPFVRGRIIDLSRRAAKRIGLVGPGTAPVEIVALGIPKQVTVNGKIRRTFDTINYDVGDFTIQVGAFREKEKAYRLKEKLSQRYKGAYIAKYQSSGGIFYRVRVGRWMSLAQARRYERILEANGYPDAIVVAR